MPLTIEEFKERFRDFLTLDRDAVDEEQGVDALDGTLRSAIDAARTALRVAERRLARLAGALRSSDSDLGHEIAEASPFQGVLQARAETLEKAVASEKADQIASAAAAFASYLGSDPLVALIDAPNPFNIPLGLRAGLKDALDHLAEQAAG